MLANRAALAVLFSSALFGSVLGIPAAPAMAGPSIGQLAGAGERPGATRLSFRVGDSVRAQVDVGSGNLLLTVRGITLPDLNRTVELGAFHNSAAVGAPATRLGKGWGLAYTSDLRLVENGDGSVTYYAVGGLTGVFDLVGGSSTTYTSPAGFKMSLLKNPGAGWTITDNATQDKLAFSPAGALVSITDRNGNVTTMTASGSDVFKSIAVATPVGVSGWSNDATITTTSGTTTIKHGNPAAPLRSVRFEPVDADTMRFVDAESRATLFDFATDGRINRVSAPGSVTTDFTYDSAGRVTSINQDESSAAGPGDSITRLAYPSATQTLLAAPDTNQSQGVSVVPHTTYTLDATQRVTMAVDAAGRTRAKTYTANFDAATFTQGAGSAASTRTNTWGANNGTSLTKTASAAGSSQQLAYTGTGMSQYNPTSATDDAGNVSTYSYNGSGNQLASTDAGSNQAKVTYNADGTVATATSPGNGSNVTSYGYSDKRLTSITPVSGSSLGARTYSYDAMGRLATATNGRGITRTFSYGFNDKVNRISFSGVDGQVTDYAYDAAGRLASRYDATQFGRTMTALTSWG